MTFIEAAQEVLKNNKNFPMSSKEIWDEIELSSLISSAGKTPQATLNTTILMSCVNGNTSKRYKNSLFRKVDDYPAKFQLINYIDDSHDPQLDVDQEPENIENIDKILLYQITSKELGWHKLSVYNNNNIIEYEITNCEEYTYIMDNGSTIKIGKTRNNPEERLSNLKTANPSISILHVFPSTQYSEGELHKRFDDFQHDREFFHYTKGLRKFMTGEIKKHNHIMKSYKNKTDLDDSEKDMINSLSI